MPAFSLNSGLRRSGYEGLRRRLDVTQVLSERRRQVGDMAQCRTLPMELWRATSTGAL